MGAEETWKSFKKLFPKLWPGHNKEEKHVSKIYTHKNVILATYRESQNRTPNTENLPYKTPISQVASFLDKLYIAIWSQQPESAGAVAAGTAVLLAGLSCSVHKRMF